MISVVQAHNASGTRYGYEVKLCVTGM